MTTILILDDEPHAREALSGIIKNYATDFEVVASCSDLTSAKAAITQHHPDIVLLDIEMGAEIGLDIITFFPHHSFKLIFITAHQNYAVNAFRLSAVDYLLKPVDPDMLVEALNKAKAAKDVEQLSSKLDHLLHNVALNGKKNKKVVLKTSDNIHVLNIEDIMYCKAERSYTKFYLADKNNILVSVALGEYERIFSDFNFIRIHQSYLLNMDYIKRYEKTDGGTIILKDGTCLPVAVRKKDHLISKLRTL
jgi:two-component system LytT family response regulator